jgi:plastocyanin
MALKTWLTLLLLTAFALAGCSGGGGDDDQVEDHDPDGTDGTTTDDGTTDDATTDATDGTATDDGTTDTTTQATPAREPVTWEVTIQGNSFSPSELTIQNGDTVHWTHNDATTPHTVTADNGEFDSGSDCPGADCMTSLVNSEFSHTFTAVAEVPYHCEVHASMTANVSVLERFDDTPSG